MSGEYTPTTAEMRAFYTAERLDGPHLEGFPEPTVEQAEAEFDRWLTQYTAEVHAAALAEQGETEWEYGNEQLMHSRVEVFPASSRAVAKAQAWLYPMRRRRKAGPWMPVEGEAG